jgi:predicted ATP-dependent endonuclease of OLD family
LLADTVKFRGTTCFKSDWSGFDEIKPINVIIGRNNAGKSHLIETVRALCEGNLKKSGFELRCEGRLDESSLRDYFPENASGGHSIQDYWYQLGQPLVGHRVSWVVDRQGRINNLQMPDSQNMPGDFVVAEEREKRVRDILRDARSILTGLHFRRLVADRDIRPKEANKSLTLGDDGLGATNIIRRYITTSSPEFPRELVQDTLLSALNEIFRDDGHFSEIVVQEHDEASSGFPQGQWEIYLGENKKNLIALSQSGSGLKTVILVLLNLLVMPILEDQPKEKYVFAFEELENNLHPALFRRLLAFLEDYATTEKAHVFLTTHSSVALDLFGASPNSQTVLVTHDGESASTRTVAAHFDQLGVVSELGARPSDLLQANGIVWVEGPSDRIYINRWLELFSDGRLREGRDYQCACYGGSLLARAQFVAPEEAESELVNLIQVNPNVAVICDGDRTAATGKGSRIKSRVQRIKAEVQEIPHSHVWITECKEIENYLPGAALAVVFDDKKIPSPGQYEPFFPSGRVSKKGASFTETRLKRNTVDKVDLASRVAVHLTREKLENRFDLAKQMRRLVETINSWNC